MIKIKLNIVIIAGGLLFVMLRRKIKKVGETVLVTNEDELNNQVVFQTQLKQTSSLQDHIFSNHFGKVSQISKNVKELEMMLSVPKLFELGAFTTRFI